MIPEPNGAKDDLSLAFHALADPTRRAILARLRQGEASVAELAQPFAMTPRAVSKHVGVLERAGLVSRSRDAQRRLSRLEPEKLKQIEQWLDDYRALWVDRLGRLDRLLAKRRQRKNG